DGRTCAHSHASARPSQRLGRLKELLPKARRFVTFYDPGNPSARESSALGREAAKHLGIELIERRVSSVEELLAGLQGLRPGDADALLTISDAMVMSHIPALVDILKPK